MTFDFKKEYRALYQPGTMPSIVTVPKMNYLAVRGIGDPNQAGGEYKESIELLYGIAYTLKMSKKSSHTIAGFFDYVVPPLEGFWWQGNGQSYMDYTRKQDMHFISLIRLPDFVTKEDFDWAVATATAKKKRDFSPVEFFAYDEGLCVQCMHVGVYDDEPVTVAAMHSTALMHGYDIDINAQRFHHEIYLSDPRKTTPEKMRTVLRHPIKKRVEPARRELREP